jgi:hypothetical protein
MALSILFTKSPITLSTKASTNCVQIFAIFVKSIQSDDSISFQFMVSHNQPAKDDI